MCEAGRLCSANLPSAGVWAFSCGPEKLGELGKHCPTSLESWLLAAVFSFVRSSGKTGCRKSQGNTKQSDPKESSVLGIIKTSLRYLKACNGLANPMYLWVSRILKSGQWPALHSQTGSHFQVNSICGVS